MAAEPTGVLLVNLGTPRSPRPGDVRRYLREFLGDPLVLDMPAPLRFLLLELVILPFRPRRSALAYQKIWGPEGSPLLVHGRALARALAAELGAGYAVELAMRYGEPGIREALEKLAARAPARLIALPLFPQYSTAATGSALAKLALEHARLRGLPALETLGAFYDRPEFIAAWAELARERLASFRPDFVLFSYHGLPERQVTALDATGRHCLAAPGCCDAIGPANRDCYRAQCFATTRALAAELEARARALRDLVPVAARAHALDQALHRSAASGARRARAPPAGDPVPRLRGRLPGDARGDRHPRARAVARAGRRGAAAGPLAQRRAGLGAGDRRLDPRPTG